MIVFFVGTPGSGKTYEAVKKIIDNLKSGRVVCTNIDGMDNPVCQEYIKSILDMNDYQFNRQFIFLNKDQVRRFWATEKVLNPQIHYDAENDVFDDAPIETEELICPKGSLVVIDEAHKFFNARDWQNSENRMIADWASTHRHEGYDLVLITQNIEKVEKQVRTLTEWTYFFRKVNFLGGAVSKKYMCYSYTGDDHDGTPLAKNVRTYSDHIFHCYKSYSHADAKEVGFMQHINILKHPVFIAIPLVLAFCGYMFSKSSFASGDLFGAKKHQASVTQTHKPVPPAAPAATSFQNISTAQHLAPVSAGLPEIPASDVPQYTNYKIDGYILDGSKIIISINGVSVPLPSPYVQRYKRGELFALADSAYFGTKPPSPAVQSFQASQSPVSDATTPEKEFKEFEPFFKN